MGITHTLVVYLGREVFGVVLAMSLGLLGLLAGWGMFIMFGMPTSWNFWFWSVTAGAGVGAAAGAGLAWLVGGSPRPVLASAGLFVLIATAGIAGAYGGYHWGQVQDVPCCAQPDVSANAYTVSGAMAAALVAGTLLGIASHQVWKLPRPPYTPQAATSTISREQA